MRKIKEKIKVKRKIKEEYPWYKFYIGMRKHLKYPECSMYEVVASTAKKYPSNIAYSYYGSKVTYKSFIRKIDEAACAFIRMDLFGR